MKNVILWGIALLGFWAYLCPWIESSVVRAILAGVVGTTLGYGLGYALMGVFVK